MGFRGRYSASGTTAEIRAIIGQIEEKIQRIRGAATPLPWQPPSQTMAPARDKWTPLLEVAGHRMHLRGDFVVRVL